MKGRSLITLAIILAAFMAMGCDDDSDNEAPEASLTLRPNLAWIYDNTTSTENPEITFNATASRDPDGEITNYHYDFGEGNSMNLSDNTTKRTYENGGCYTTGLTVSDNDGAEDRTTRLLTINYQYYREGQPLSAAGDDSREHPFQVSGLYPNTGQIEVNVTSDLGSSSVNVTVYNSTGEVVKNRKEENIQDNALIEITLARSDFSDYKYGEWRVKVECENGNIHYDITVQVRYKK
ncbi:MAG: PKD domain-containing protein [Thermoplasmata archaeon]|nr:PKD domain-containing protein [Thermoplasmata archaeon]